MPYSALRWDRRARDLPSPESAGVGGCVTTVAAALGRVWEAAGALGADRKWSKRLGGGNAPEGATTWIWAIGSQMGAVRRSLKGAE